MDCSKFYPCPLQPIHGLWQTFLELFSILFLGVRSIFVSHYQTSLPCWCLSARRTSDPLFNLKTPQICLRRLASPNQQSLAPQQQDSPRPGEISSEGYPLPTSKCRLNAWKFWKYRYPRNKLLFPPPPAGQK